MPRCESCGSIVKKTEIRLNAERSRTCCVRCENEGPVNNEQYQFNLRLTENGVEMSARTPSTGFEYKDSWGGIRAKLTDIKNKLTEEPPKALPSNVVGLPVRANEG